MADTTLTLKLNAVNNASGVLAGLSGGLDSVAKKAAQLGTSLSLTMTLPFALMARDVLKFSNDFDNSMRNVQAISRESDASIAALGTRIRSLAVSGDVVSKATELSKAFYQIQSSGVSGAAAEDVLYQSARGATAGMSTAADVAKALTATLNAYGEGAYSAALITDMLVRSVDIGVFSMTEISQQMGDFITSGALLKVPFEELLGIMTTLTKKGVPVSEAASSLNNILRAFIMPGKQAKATAEEYGVALDMATVKERGLTAAIADMNARIGDDTDAWARLFPNIRSARGVFGIIADDMKMVRSDTLAIGNAMGTTDAVVGIALRSWQNQWAILGNKIDEIKLKIGDAVMPDMLGHLNRQIPAILENLGKIAPTFFKVIIDGALLATAALAGMSPALLTVSATLVGIGVVAGPLLTIFGNLARVLGLVVAFAKLPAVAGIAAAVLASPLAIPAGVGLAATGATLAGANFMANQDEGTTPTSFTTIAAQKQLAAAQNEEAGILAVTTTRNLTAAEQARLTVLAQTITYLQQVIAAQSLYSSDAQRLQAHQAAINQKMLEIVTVGPAVVDTYAAQAAGLFKMAPAFDSVTAAAMKTAAAGEAARKAVTGVILAGGLAGAGSGDLVAQMGLAQGAGGSKWDQGYLDSLLSQIKATGTMADDKITSLLNSYTVLDTATGNLTTAQRGLLDATTPLRDAFGSLKNEAEAVSKRLSDLTGAPGAAGGVSPAEDPNGFMRDVRRLQAWIKDGSWGAEATEHGFKTKEEAAADIGSMQLGDWSKVLAPEHNNLVDPKLMQAAQAAGQSQVALPGKVAQPGVAVPQTPQAQGGINLGVDVAKLGATLNTDIDKNQAVFSEAGGKVFGLWQAGFFAAADTSNAMVNLVGRLVVNAVAGLIPAGK